MTAIGKIIVLCAAVVLGGALLAPPLYWAGQWAAVNSAGLLPQLAGIPFPRYLSRAIMVTALCAVVPWLRWLGIRSFADLGLQQNRRRWQDLALGAGISTGGLAIATVILLASGWAVVREPMRWYGVAMAVPTGVVVALIEESFFRGALFGALRRSLRWPAALAFLSLLFALVHFVKPVVGVAGGLSSGLIGWTSGFDHLPHAVARFAEPQQLFSGFVTLVLLGWILGWTVVRTDSLFVALGLHGGWIFSLRLFRAGTERIGEPGWWVGKGIRTGLLPLLLLLASWALLGYFLRRRDRAASVAAEPQPGSNCP